VLFECQTVVSRPAATEALKKWAGGRSPTARVIGRGLPLPIYRDPEMLPPEIFFENTGANQCNMVHFGLKICILNNLMLNLDFGRSI